MPRLLLVILLLAAVSATTVTKLRQRNRQQRANVPDFPVAGAPDKQCVAKYLQASTVFERKVAAAAIAVPELDDLLINLLKRVKDLVDLKVVDAKTLPFANTDAWNEDYRGPDAKSVQASWDAWDFKKQGFNRRELFAILYTTTYSGPFYEALAAAAEKDCANINKKLNGWQLNCAWLSQRAKDKQAGTCRAWTGACTGTSWTADWAFFKKDGKTQGRVAHAQQAADWCSAKDLNHKHHSNPYVVTPGSLKALGLPLSNREIAKLALQKLNNLQDNTVLPYCPGSNLYTLNAVEHKDTQIGQGYLDIAATLGHPVGAGPSGTTSGMLSSAIALGFDKEELYAYRVALFSWMMQFYDHTFLEYMMGSNEQGLSWTQGADQAFAAANIWPVPQNNKVLVGAQATFGKNMAAISNDDPKKVCPAGKF